MRLLLAIAVLIVTAAVFFHQGSPQGGVSLLVAGGAACLAELMGVRLPYYGTVSFGLVVYLPVAASLSLGPASAVSIAVVALLLRELWAASSFERAIDEISLDLFPLGLACLTPLLFSPTDPQELRWLALGVTFVSLRRAVLAAMRMPLPEQEVAMVKRLSEATANLRWGILGLALLVTPLLNSRPWLALALLPIIFSLRKAAIHAWAYLDKEDKTALRKDLKGAKTQVVELARSLQMTEVQKNLLHDLSKDTVAIESLTDLLVVLERKLRSLKLGRDIEILLRQRSGWLFLCFGESGKAEQKSINPDSLPLAFKECWQNSIELPEREGRTFYPLPGVGVLNFKSGFKDGSGLAQLASLFSGQVALACLSTLRFLELQDSLRQTAGLNLELEDRNRSLHEALEKLKTSEAKLIEGAKLAAVGQLSAGIAHEINNPLGSIRLGIEATLRKEPLSDFSRDLLGKGLKGVERAQSVIGSLLTYSRAGSKGKVSINPWEVLLDTYSFLSATLRMQNITVVEPEIGPQVAVLANPQEIQQILTNLLLNAGDAVVTSTKREVIMRGKLDGVSEVVIEVHDSGPGIEPEVKTRIFDPFFTTKPVGKGTGLGLSVSREMAVANGGRLEVRVSELLGGACFSLVLPLASAKPD